MADNSFADVLAQTKSYKKTWEKHIILGNMSYKKERRENESVLWCSVVRPKRKNVVVCPFGSKVYGDGGDANVTETFAESVTGFVNAGICKGRG